MSKQIIVLTGSARPNSAGVNLAEMVKKTIEVHEECTVEVVNAADLQLPFFNATTAPSTEGFVPDNASAQVWTAKVAQTHGFVFVMPEYNNNMSAVQKNAIDWISKEWSDKPVGLVYYNWYDHSNMHDTVLKALGVVKAKPVTAVTHVRFMKTLSPDGTILDAQAIQVQLDATIGELTQMLA